MSLEELLCSFIHVFVYTSRLNVDENEANGIDLNFTNLKKFHFVVQLQVLLIFCQFISFFVFVHSSIDKCYVWSDSFLFFIEKANFIVNVNNLIAMPKSKVYFYRFIHTERSKCEEKKFRQLKWRLDIKLYPRIRHRSQDPFGQNLSDRIGPTIECELIHF